MQRRRQRWQFLLSHLLRPAHAIKHIKAGTLRTTRNIWFRIFIAANLLRLFEKTKPSTPVLTEE
jgi:hypothetical protein